MGFAGPHHHLQYYSDLKGVVYVKNPYLSKSGVLHQPQKYLADSVMVWLAVVVILVPGILYGVLAPVWVRCRLTQ